MAPIDPDLRNSNTLPYTYLAVYLTASSALIAFVARYVIYKPYKSLPPSQDTRWRQSNRENHVRVVTGLAGLSLCQGLYHLAQILSLSYKVWANEMGQALPSRPYSLDSLNELMLGRWLTDVSPLSIDAWEIAVESSTRYWWTQQLFLGSAAWAIYVGIEGRRRNIHHLWAFVLLVPVISQAFAMNMFFLAILSSPVPQTPKPRPGSKADQLQLQSSEQAGGLTRHSSPHVWTILNKIKPFLPNNPAKPHPPSWHPYPWAINLQSSALIVITFLLPYTTSTPHFSKLLLVNFAVLFRLIYPQRLGPIGYGSTTFTPTQISTNYLNANRFVAACSFILFVKQTFVGLLDSDPGAHRHRHSEYLAKLHLPHESHRSQLSRSQTALTGLLGALHDHPATSRLGYDVLLCAISLVTWSVIRGLDVTKMLAALGLAAAPPASVASATSKPKRRRSRKSSASAIATSGSDATTTLTTTEPEKKTKKKKEKDAMYRPAAEDAVAPTAWQGEEEHKQNGEAGAVAAVSFVLGGLGALSSAVLASEEM